MIHIDCTKEALNFAKYDLAEDEIFVIDNLFPWWFVEHLDQTILHGFGWQYGLCSSHKNNPDGNYLHYGVREHAMAAAMNGLALHGGIIPYGGTFLVFLLQNHLSHNYF